MKKKRQLGLACLVLLCIILIAAGVIVWKHSSSTKETPIRAMYLPFENSGYIMVDQDNETVFTVTMPEELYDQNGKKITEQDLKKGNILNIYGDGIMLESYPGQYPGVTKIQVAEEGTPSDADCYQEIINQLEVKRDPSEIPYLSVEYRTSLAIISADTMKGGYSWTYTVGNEMEQSVVADSLHITHWKDIPVMNVEGDTDMTLNFDLVPKNVYAVRYPADELETDTKGEDAEIQKNDETYVLKAAQKGYLYQIQAEWENGRVEYGFLVK